VLACSALKDDYRRQLICDRFQCRFILLHVAFKVVRQRLLERKGHFMGASLLQSQFETLDLVELQADDINNDIPSFKLKTGGNTLISNDELDVVALIDDNSPNSLETITKQIVDMISIRKSDVQLTIKTKRQ
jgi:carbohydrate kinase (thermoresistant glucokinase family)